jgi:PAS domain S-box-containing protein
VHDITDLKQAVKEIESLAKFPGENPNPILRIATDCTITYANRGSVPLLELWDCQVGQRLLDEYGNLILDVLRSGTSREIEILSGSTTYSLLLAPITEMGYVNIYGRDITKRKRAEIALQESEQRYATTLASIGDAVIAIDIRGKITFMNGVAEELTGWTLDEASMLPAKAVFNIINEYTRREVDDPVTKVLENGVIVGLANHTILIRKDGTEVAIDDSGAPIKDRDGNITGVVLVFRDITERKKAEEAIQRQAELIDLSPDGIMILKLDGTITFWSHGAELLYGWSKQEAAGQQAHTLLRTQFPQAMELIVEQIRQTGRWSGEIIHNAKDGRQVIVRSMWLAKFDDQGNVSEILESSVDITEHKHTEKTLRETTDYLENLIITPKLLLLSGIHTS